MRRQRGEHHRLTVTRGDPRQWATLFYAGRVNRLLMAHPLVSSYKLVVVPSTYPFESPPLTRGKISPVA